MLSIFPDLLAYQELAPLLLRVTLGVIYLFWGYKRFHKQGGSNNSAMALLEVIVGILLIIGLYTQVAALVSAIILIVYLIGKIRSKSFLSDGVNYHLILLVISLSLLVLGAGVFSFDLPL